MTELLTKRCPDAEGVCGEARDLPKFLADRGTSSADLIITLPWVAYAPSATQWPLLATVVELLASEGAYTQAAYAWTRWAAPARRQLRQLRASFEEVVISEAIRDVPPSRVYLARRPGACGGPTDHRSPDADTRLSSDTGGRRLTDRRRRAPYSTRSMVRVVPSLSKVTTMAPSAIGPLDNSYGGSAAMCSPRSKAAK